MSKKIGLALGGGAARGISHIPLLEAIDELGVRPVKMAGTSIGALVGAAYASGVTGAELRRPDNCCIRKQNGCRQADVQTPEW